MRDPAYVTFLARRSLLGEQAAPEPVENHLRAVLARAFQIGCRVSGIGCRENQLSFTTPDNRHPTTDASYFRIVVSSTKVLWPSSVNSWRASRSAASYHKSHCT